MGNPAGEKRKKREKRRKKYEARLGPGAYLPKEQREAVNAQVQKMEAERKARAEQRKKEQAAPKAQPAPAEAKA
ncbi:MAG: hypothetical protein RMJ56_10650 [Gemmataceae bacterium]|nr:hypothetical protein [Gemmata sp.]MDW8198049.1 hypothetical protein [Gemmataceae bacterium]